MCFHYKIFRLKCKTILIIEITHFCSIEQEHTDSFIKKLYFLNSA